MTDFIAGLDRWITGDCSHLQAPLDPPEVEEDEGIAILQSAINYLKPRSDADEPEQESGEFEASEILKVCITLCEREYECRFCGAALRRRRDRYCSRNCARADAEGL